jgi:PhzF family phenazine biosynthesis protein
MFQIYQIDAFTNDVFGGNPAAVVPLQTWIPDEYLQKIAAENNLSETAFYVEEDEGYRLRWFTPIAEVDLCGHATLATAYVLFFIYDLPKEILTFYTRSGELRVKKVGNLLQMDFPQTQTAPTTRYKEALNKASNCNQFKEIRTAGNDILVVFGTEEEVAQLKPNMSLLEQIDCRGIICTAPSSGEGIDFVSRFFAPQVGVPEDPVTGSAHTSLVTYWSEKWQKNTFTAKQISKRTGILTLEKTENRVLIQGNAKLYLEGKIYLA